MALLILSFRSYAKQHAVQHAVQHDSCGEPGPPGDNLRKQQTYVGGPTTRRGCDRQAGQQAQPWQLMLDKQNKMGHIHKHRWPLKTLHKDTPSQQLSVTHPPKTRHNQQEKLQHASAMPMTSARPPHPPTTSSHCPARESSHRWPSARQGRYHQLHCKEGRAVLPSAAATHIHR
jgi:hypothetical protein